MPVTGPAVEVALGVGRWEHMIINTGARTDTAQYYARWLLTRFREGFVYVRNPLFPEKVSRYVLDPAVVDCVVFCSKNYAPLLGGLHEIRDRYNTYFHFTITAYGTDVEPGVPSVPDAVETLLDLERQVGAKRICWRYDPVFLTSTYTIGRHLETFAWMAERLAGHVDRCIFSFVEVYRKLERNFPNIIIPSLEDRDELARGLASIAHAWHIPIQTCGNNGDWSRYGIAGSACTTLSMLGAANGVEFRALRHKGQRPGCGCFESRDIGCYDSCPNGCRYCYANRSPELARRNYRELHDPESPILLGRLRETDEITEAAQRTCLVRRATAQVVPGQQRLF